MCVLFKCTIFITSIIIIFIIFVIIYLNINAHIAQQIILLGFCKLCYNIILDFNFSPNVKAKLCMTVCMSI